MLDRRLRSRAARLLDALPSVEALESGAFQALRAGFAVLTLALFSGFLFVENLFAQHLVHKTVLSCLAWVVFAMLLFGRWRFGWRGRTALRWALSGFALLGLAYFGSKIVLESIPRPALGLGMTPLLDVPIAGLALPPPADPRRSSPARSGADEVNRDRCGTSPAKARRACGRACSATPIDWSVSRLQHTRDRPIVTLVCVEMGGDGTAIGVRLRSWCSSSSARSCQDRRRVTPIDASRAAACTR